VSEDINQSGSGLTRFFMLMLFNLTVPSD